MTANTNVTYNVLRSLKIFFFCFFVEIIWWQITETFRCVEK